MKLYIFFFCSFSYGFSIWYFRLFIEIEIEHKAAQQMLSLEEIVLDNDIENKELDKFLEE